MRHLLVDGRNSLYRALFAGLSDQNFVKSGYSSVIIFCRFLNHYLQLFNPTEVHVFWDDKLENLWRKKVFDQYKAQRKEERLKRNKFDVGDTMGRLVTIAQALIPEMGIRMYSREGMEADDLIYAFVQTLSYKETATIVSSDSDFVQLEKGSVHVFNPMHTGHKEDRYTLLMKCLMGDKTDNVPGYTGIGPKKAAKLCDSNSDLKAFLKTRGLTILLRNRDLIDLTRCPFVKDNVQYVESVRSTKPVFDGQAIESIAMRLKVRGLIAEFHRCILPFKSMKAI